VSMLSVYTRHHPDCKNAGDRTWRRCSCPKWIWGSLSGRFLRQSARTPRWEEAEAYRQKLEEAAARGLPSLPPPAPSRPTDDAPLSAAASISRVEAHSPSVPETSSTPGTGFKDNAPTLECHAAQIRSSIGEAMGGESAVEESSGALAVANENSGSSVISTSGAGAKSSGVARSSAPAKRGPSVHRYNLGTWTAYHAARIAAGSVAGAAKRVADRE
jgi:hypothetical protein